MLEDNRAGIVSEERDLAAGWVMDLNGSEVRTERPEKATRDDWAWTGEKRVDF